MITATVNGTEVRYTRGGEVDTTDLQLESELLSARWRGANPITGSTDHYENNVYSFLTWCFIVDQQFTIKTEDDDARLYYRVLTEGDVLIN